MLERDLRIRQRRLDFSRRQAFLDLDHYRGGAR
jgi:hypothetical protein